MAQDGKSKWHSKTLWVNALALAATILQLAGADVPLDAETQVAFLAVVNFLLRLVTKEPVR